MKLSIILISTVMASLAWADGSGLLTVGDLMTGSQTPVVTRRDMEVMNNQDRAAVYGELSRYDQFLTRHCTTRTDGSTVLDETCGRLDVRNGDPGFHPESLPSNYQTSAYAQIPKNSTVNVYTRCEADGKFYTRINYTDANGRTRVFKNPYSNVDKCITSPGQLEREDYTTKLPPFVRGSGYITAWHIVSDQKSYSGAEMPWSVWLNESGYAYHAGTSNRPVDGYPASAGCFRMEEPCAKGLFNLVRRVGTNNMNFYWGGYNHPTTGQPCRRPDGSTSPLAADQTPENSSQSRKNVFQRIGDWWRGLTGRNTPSEETAAPANGTSSDR